MNKGAKNHLFQMGFHKSPEISDNKSTQSVIMIHEHTKIISILKNLQHPTISALRYYDL